ncbi:MAG TPA: cysteine desulfurase [Chloroflexota bacterium]|nr:cysteine desulfurase [Chloroflexota bacterium]
MQETHQAVLDVERPDWDEAAVAAIRAAFPILATSRNGKPLVYLDNGATSQKPAAVIAAMTDYYERYNANVHRGIYAISEEATAAYEGARAAVARFINARAPEEVVFTRNTSEAINLVAYSWGRRHLQAGDAILTSVMEHHANLVPWQLLAEERGAHLLHLPLDEQGRLDLSTLDALLARRVKLVAITQMSNVLGTINPVAEIARRAHAAGALVLVDAAQSVPHLGVDVQAIDCDFLAFSAHKMCGPTGIGALYGRLDVLEAMPPFLGGGSMIRTVTLEKSTFADVPQRFEAGTPAIAEAVGFGAAVRYLEDLGMAWVHARERALATYMMDVLATVPGLTLYGPPPAERGGVVSFSLRGAHPHDVASILDEDNIAVRAGHHCCQPLMRALCVPATVRASVYFYNTQGEIDALARGLGRAGRVFGVEQ